MVFAGRLKSGGSMCSSSCAMLPSAIAILLCASRHIMCRGAVRTVSDPEHCWSIGWF